MRPPNQALCGAKTRKGTECKGLAMANGRCKLHGGKATGAKNPHRLLGEKNPLYSHGIYSKFFTTDEKDLIDAGAIRRGQVDDEIDVVRIRLKRLLDARAKWEASLETGDGAEEQILVETVDDESVTKDGDVVPTTKTIKRLPDFDGQIERCLSRIESLEKTRKELMKSDEDAEGEPGTMRLTITGGLPSRED